MSASPWADSLQTGGGDHFIDVNGCGQYCQHLRATCCINLHGWNVSNITHVTWCIKLGIELTSVINYHERSKSVKIPLCFIHTDNCINFSFMSLLFRLIHWEQMPILKWVIILWSDFVAVCYKRKSSNWNMRFELIRLHTLSFWNLVL